MQKNRRNFLQTAGLMTAGSILFPQWACTGSPAEGAAAEAATEAVAGSLKNFGIQLYTLRDVIMADPKATIKEISTYGFTQIEGYEGDLGLFWGMPHTDFKTFLNDQGLSMVSSHCNIHENFEEKAAHAAEAGLEYLICPWVGPQKSMDDWKKVTDQFNAAGETCRQNGIKFAYHNHAYSFIPFTGMIPHDFLMDNTDPALVDHEMDIYWVVTGGADPVEYLTKYSNRFTLCHVKDRLKDAGEEREASCDLGTGMIDYPKILKVAKDNGMKYFIMEQERYDGSTPMKSAETGANYLKNLVFA